MQAAHSSTRLRANFVATTASIFIGLSLPACVPPVVEGDAATDETLEEIVNMDEVRASFQNTPPIARAGADRNASPGEEVILNATTSTDEDRNRLSFVWTQVSGTPQIDFDSSAFSSVTSFKVPSDLAEDTTLVFSVAVLDGFSVAFDEVSVRVVIEE
ncbi:MAG: hypothetical protein AB7N71_03165 [Phycisphaerae bacterium]